MGPWAGMVPVRTTFEKFHQSAHLKVSAGLVGHMSMWEAILMAISRHRSLRSSLAMLCTCVVPNVYTCDWRHKPLVRHYGRISQLVISQLNWRVFTSILLFEACRWLRLFCQVLPSSSWRAGKSLCSYPLHLFGWAFRVFRCLDV